MRSLILLFTVTATLLSSSRTEAQNAYVRMRSGDTREIHVKASSDSHLFVDGGSYDFDTIDSISFESDRPIDAGLYSKLMKAGVRVTAGGVAKYALSPIVVNEQRRPMDGFEQEDPLEKFEKQRAAGKFIQMIGAAALSTSVYLLAKYRNDDLNAKGNYEPNKGPTELAIAGGALLVIGFGIDIEAGRHLKKKH